MMLRFRACGLSDVGMSRSHNEDCFAIDPQHQLYVVADGMGGHSHGEIASRIAVDTIRDFVRQPVDPDQTWPANQDGRHRRMSGTLVAAIRLAHDKVLGAIRDNATLHGMGTTVASVMALDGMASVAHVGDSRVYRLREGRLELLTQDHTWVNEQVVAGFLSEEQARVHPLKNVVTRALGGDNEVEVDVREVELKAGDLFLLCSDGLTTMMPDARILENLTASNGLEEACRRLVQEANAAGGLDNVTIVLLQAEPAS